MDLFGPSAIKSYGGNLYTLVIVDDYSRYTRTKFLKTKNKAFEKFEILSRKIQNQLGSSIVAIRTDHGRKFDNKVQFGAYCDAQGITHNFSAPRSPQSNGVLERKNRNLQEMSRNIPPPTKLSALVDDDVGEEEAIENNTKVVNNNNVEDESIEVDEVVNIKESKNHLDEVTWIAFGGNTRDLGSFGEETNKTTTLHQILEEVVHTECGDGVMSFKQRR
ncbi:retrovirus-related pol polyprotein from transposon TNT 1-94 [Tanacetum coccineum]